MLPINSTDFLRLLFFLSPLPLFFCPALYDHQSTTIHHTTLHRDRVGSKGFPSVLLPHLLGGLRLPCPALPADDHALVAVGGKHVPVCVFRHRVDVRGELVHVSPVVPLDHLQVVEPAWGSGGWVWARR